MSNGTVVQNIKANRQSLLIILLAIGLFWAFGIKQSARSDETIEQRGQIKVALFKEFKEGNSYFREFIPILHKALTANGWEPTIMSSLARDEIFKKLKTGDIHIAGEFSPIKYVENHQESGFQPFLGMEYNGRAYYHSVFFAPERVSRTHEEYLLKSEPGYDNLSKIRDGLTEADGTYAILKDKSSTSGYLYPK